MNKKARTLRAFSYLKPALAYWAMMLYRIVLSFSLMM